MSNSNPKTNTAASLRRAGRERALQTLYTVEVGKQSVDEVFDASQEVTPLDDTTRDFSRRLIDVTLRSQPEIDPILERLATGFPISRQTVVDRNILRLAAAEILFEASNAPPGAVVNEAVELAKKFSTAESGRFVNGVLGALVREMPRTGETPGDEIPTEPFPVE